MATRREKANKLKQYLNNGPALSLHVFGPVDIGKKLTAEENEAVQQKVRSWLDTWVKPLVGELVTELKSEGWQQ